MRVHRNRLKLLAVVAVASIATIVSRPSPAVTPDWARRWRADLAFMADTLPQVHPNLFHTMPREQFLAEIESLSARLDRLEQHQITVELARIMARVGDGHTRLTLPFDSTASFFTGHSSTAPPNIPGLVFRHLPIRLRSFAEGWYVVSATTSHRDLLGGRVVELGQLPMDQAVAAVAPVVHRDNDQHLRHLLATYMVVPEVLEARGVTRDLERVRLVVETPAGRRTATLAPVPVGTAVDWLDARGPDPPPRAEQRPEESHWLQRLEGTTVLYARYREVMDDPNQTVAAFADTLFQVLDGPDANALILDVRDNVGGDGFLNGPLVRGVIASPDLQEPGRFFVLADRGTFSAAIMLLGQLERLTPAVFVGEKTGGAPNAYGDSRRIRLPETGLTLRVATLYWQTTDPRDARDGITPHVAVEARFGDWRQRRDAALDTVLALIGPPADPVGVWRGEIGIANERFPLTVRVQRNATEWTARIDLAAFGISDGQLQDVVFENGVLAFALSPQLSFRGRVTARGITGVATFQGNPQPFVLARVE